MNHTSSTTRTNVQLFSIFLAAVFSLCCFTSSVWATPRRNKKHNLDITVLATETSVITNAKIKGKYKKGKRGSWKKIRKLERVSDSIRRVKLPKNARYILSVSHKPYKFKRVKGRLKVDSSIEIAANNAMTVNVSGQVLYEHSKTPVPNTPLSLIVDKDKKLETDEQGRFSFSNVLKDTSYSLVVHNNSVAGRNTLQHTASQDMYHEILISESLTPVSISGRVTSLLPGKIDGSPKI